MLVEECQIALRILHMFGRRRPFAAGTDRIKPRGITRQGRFQADVTLPLGIVIIDIAETLTRLEGKTLEGNVPGISRVAAIVFAEDMEMVQVFIAPRKENLEHVMEVRQSRVAVDQKAPPDERTNVS